jgi:hypothetical protein
MSKTALKHVLLAPEKPETGISKNSNNFDLVTITQIKNHQPEIIKFQNIDNLHRFKVINTNTNKINGENSNNNNSLNSLSFKTHASANGNKSRILVKRDSQINIQNFGKLNIFQEPSLANESNANIKQNIIGSMRSYGNFINNPLTSNQSLVNPNYNENLLGMKSRTIYLLSTNDQSSSFENFTFKKSNFDEIKQRHHQSSRKKVALSSEINNDSDSEVKQDYVPSTKILNNETIKSSLVQSKQFNISAKTSNQVESSDNFQKKVCFSDTDSKDAVRDGSSNGSNFNPVTSLSKNIFLNYKPTSSQNKHQSNSSIVNEKSKHETHKEIKISNNNNNTTLNISTNNKTFTRRNSILNNSNNNNNNQNYEKKPPVLTKSKTSIDITQISNPKKVTKITPEQYLDRLTILRIENWIQDVNNQTKIVAN